MRLGVNISNDASQFSADCAEAAKLGFKYVRISLEMTNSNSLSQLQQAATAAKNNGLHLVQCCQGMPASLSANGQAGHYPPKNDAAAQTWGEWLAQCALIVDTTAGFTSCGNEWDNYGWTGTPDATAVAELHAAALAARDKYAPGTKFVTCEMAPGSNPEPFAFLQAIVKQAPVILKDPAVFIGWHPYVDARFSALYVPPPGTWYNNCVRMIDVHQWLVTQHKAHKAFMVGEWGVPFGPASHSQKLGSTAAVADYVRNSYLPAFSTMELEHGMRFAALCWYNLRMGSQPSDDWAHYCGVLDINGNEEPVAAVLAAA